MVEIDNLDRKILHLLDGNSRQSASEIARKCRVHKSVVTFRINRLLKEEVIRQFVAMISPSVLGLIPCKFYFQLQNLTGDKQREIDAFIKTLPSYWSARVSGQWDLVIGVMAKNLKEISDIESKILNKFGEDIIKKSFSILVEAPHFYRKYLSEDKNTSIKYWISQGKTQNIDELDLKILKIFAENCRTPIVDIAEKTNVTVKTIISRIRELERKKIIYDYRISLNLDKLNMNFYKCFISLKNSNSEDLKKFIQYCANQENITHLVQCVGEWELEPEFEVKSYKDFQTILREIREKFSKIIKHIEVVDILEEKSYICLPTLD